MSNQMTLDDLGKRVGLKNIDTNKAIEKVKLSLLFKMHRADPKNDREKELNEKIEAVYKNWYSLDFPTPDIKIKVISPFFMGPPGHGKTKSTEVAAKEVCAALGLNFVQSPLPKNYVASYNDFIFAIMECSGENSNILVGGLPTKVTMELPDGSSQEAMVKAPNKTMATIGHTAGGLLVLDDVSNASPNVQNSLLSVVQFGRFQDGLDLGNTLVTLTGNLGALDGTYVTKQSQAMSGRVQKFLVYDKIELFMDRVLKDYRDDIGDMGITGFLQRSPEHFAKLPPTNAKSEEGYPNPRNWINYIDAARTELIPHGGRAASKDVLQDLRDMAENMLGPDVGAKLSSYYYSMMMGADPLAKNAIIDGKVNTEKFKEKYGGGTSEPQLSFGYEYATALSDYAVRFIATNPDKNFEAGIKRYAEALLMLNESEFGFGLNYFKNKLSAQVDAFVVGNNERSAKRELIGDIKEKIGNIFVGCQDCTKDHRSSMINILSDYDKLDTVKKTRKIR